MAVKAEQSGEKPGIGSRIGGVIVGFIGGIVGSLLVSTVGILVAAGLALASGELLAAGAILVGGPILSLVAGGPFILSNTVRGVYLGGTLGLKEGMGQLVSEMTFQKEPLLTKWSKKLYNKLVGKEESETPKVIATQQEARLQASMMAEKERVSITTVGKVDLSVVESIRKRITPSSPYAGCRVEHLDDGRLRISGKDPTQVGQLVKNSSVSREGLTISGQDTNKVDQLLSVTKGLSIKEFQVGDKQYTYNATAGGFLKKEEVPKASPELQDPQPPRKHTFTPAMKAAIAQNKTHFIQPQPSPSTKQQQSKGPSPTPSSDDPNHHSRLR